MPLLRIDITGPKPAEYVSALLRQSRAAVLESLGVPDDRVTVRVIETPASHVDVPNCRTERYTVVEVLMYEGRTPELKAALVSALRGKLAEEPGIEPSEVAVSLRDAATVDLDVLAGEA